MKVVLQFVACTVAVLFVGRQAVWLFASDETRIRWTIEEMVEGFNDARLAPAIGGLHPDWRVPDTSIARPLVADGLRSLFFTEKLPESRAFALRAEIGEDGIDVTVDGESAQAAFEVRMLRLGTDPPELEWHVALENELVDDPELGWRIVATRYESLAGDSPGGRRR